MRRLTALDGMPPAEVRRILALAALSVLEREARQPTRMVTIQLDKPYDLPLSEAAIREITRGLLEAKRRAGGFEPVDLSQLRDG